LGEELEQDVWIWFLDYFTMNEYKPLLANLEVWMAKSSIKEPLLWPTIPSPNQKLSTECESKQSTKTKIFLQAIFWKKKTPNVIIIKKLARRAICVDHIASY
jgi:hypothetical protein